MKGMLGGVGAEELDEIKRTINKALAQYLEEKLMADLKDNFQGLMKVSFSEAFESVILPSFEKYLVKIFDKTNLIFEKGFKYYNEKIMIEEKRNSQVKEQFAQILNMLLENSKSLKKTTVEFSHVTKEINTSFTKDILKRITVLEETMEKLSEKQDRSMDLLEKLASKLLKEEEPRGEHLLARESHMASLASREMESGHETPASQSYPKMHAQQGYNPYQGVPEQRFLVSPMYPPSQPSVQQYYYQPSMSNSGIGQGQLPPLNMNPPLQHPQLQAPGFQPMPMYPQQQMMMPQMVSGPMMGQQGGPMAMGALQMMPGNAQGRMNEALDDYDRQGKK